MDAEIPGLGAEGPRRSGQRGAAGTGGKPLEATSVPGGGPSPRSGAGIVGLESIEWGTFGPGVRGSAPRRFPAMAASEQLRPAESGTWAGLILAEARRERPLLAVTAGLAAVHGVSHAALAVAAGLVGRELVAAGSLVTVHVERAALLGLGAAAAKSIAASLLAFSESQVAARGAERLRRGALGAVLAGNSHDAPPRVLATIAVRVREVEQALRHGALGVARGVAQIVPLGAALIVLSPALAAAAVGVLGPFAGALSAARRRLRRAHERSQALAEELHAGVDELVSHADLWRAYGAGSIALAAVDRASREARGASSRSDASRAALSAANEVLAALALLGAVLFARAAGLPLGDGRTVAFVAVFFMAYRPVRDLADARGWLEAGRAAFDALPRTPLAAPVVEPVPRAHAAARLVVERVGRSDSPVRTSFSVGPGEIVAITGPTGSGKTTLLRCLLGLEPAVGRVRYGERDVSSAPAGPRDRPFAWVPQDAPLVTGTVVDNVALLGASPEAAQAALRDLGAEGLAALGGERVGPGARPLSGGERRLVALARALASGLPVLLLDEPTEGLDSRAARRVVDAIARVAGTRTVVLVTHREDVAGLAHRVVAVGEDAPSVPALRLA